MRTLATWITRGAALWVALAFPFLAIAQTYQTANPALGGAETILCKQAGVWKACTPAMLKGYIGSPAGAASDVFYDTVAMVQATSFAGSVSAIQTAGYYAAGDGGAARYVRSGTSGAWAGRIQSADGQWWALAPGQALNVLMAGAACDGVTSDTAAFNSAIAALPSVTGVTNWGRLGVPAGRACAVHVVLPSDVILDGGVAVDPYPNGSIRGHLIPDDITQPVVTCGNDTARVYACGVINMTITSTTAAATNGSIGLLVGGGAHSAVISNVTICCAFTQYWLKSTGGSGWEAEFNTFSSVDLISGNSIGNYTAMLGVYEGGTWNTANQWYGLNIQQADTATGHAVIVDSTELYVQGGYWQNSGTLKGVLVQKSWATAPKIYAAAEVRVDNPSSSAVQLESSISSDTATLPVNWLQGPITFVGQYKNAAGTTKAINGVYTWLSNIPVITNPLIYGTISAYNETSGDNVQLISVSGAGDDVQVGGGTHEGALNLVSGSGKNINIEPGGTTTVTGGSNYIEPQTDNAISSGGASNRWQNVYAINNRVYNQDFRNGVLAWSVTAPTVTSGLGTSPTVAGVGTDPIIITVGATGTPSTTEVLAMPSGGSTGWACGAEDRTSAITGKETATTTTSVTFTWSAAPSNSDVLQHRGCRAY